jgi:hypothetical protein
VHRTIIRSALFAYDVFSPTAERFPCQFLVRSQLIPMVFRNKGGGHGNSNSLEVLVHVTHKKLSCHKKTNVNVQYILIVLNIQFLYVIF